MIRAALLAIVLCGGCAFGQSKESPQGAQPPTKEQQIEKPGERSSSATPVGDDAKFAPSTGGVVSNIVKTIGKCNTECGNAQPDKDWWREFRTDPIATFTGLLFVATVLLWWSTRTLVKGGEKTAERQLRAYVGLSEVALELPNYANVDYVPQQQPIPGEIVRDCVVLIVRNYGETPASRVSTRAYWTVVPVEQRLPIGFAYADREPIPNEGGVGFVGSSFSLFPDQAFNSRIAIRDVTPFIRAGRREVNLYLYGHITYFDIFGRQQWTDFCRLYEPWRSNDDAFVPIDEHNDAT
jgi:hypothetical protein